MWTNDASNSASVSLHIYMSQRREDLLVAMLFPTLHIHSRTLSVTSWAPLTVSSHNSSVCGGLNKSRFATRLISYGSFLHVVPSRLRQDTLMLIHTSKVHQSSTQSKSVSRLLTQLQWHRTGRTHKLSTEEVDESHHVINNFNVNFLLLTLSQHTQTTSMTFFFFVKMTVI